MLAKVGGVGGVIMVGPSGQPALGHTSVKMPWAVCQPSKPAQPKEKYMTESAVAVALSATLQAGTEAMKPKLEEASVSVDTGTSETTAICRQTVAAAAAEAAAAGRWLRSGMDSNDAPKDLCIPK